MTYTVQTIDPKPLRTSWYEEESAPDFQHREEMGHPSLFRQHEGTRLHRVILIMKQRLPIEHGGGFSKERRLPCTEWICPKCKRRFTFD